MLKRKGKGGGDVEMKKREKKRGKKREREMIKITSTRSKMAIYNKDFEYLPPIFVILTLVHCPYLYIVSILHKKFKLFLNYLSLIRKAIH